MTDMQGVPEDTLARLNEMGVQYSAYQGRMVLNFHDLRDKDLKGMYFGGAYLIGTNLAGAALDRSCFVKANLGGANLFEASLVRSDFLDTNLSMACLVKADLRGAILSGANLRGAKYSSETQWPVSFDPEATGCQFVPNLNYGD